eukprot:1844146-Amphidinium_carterae.1
MIESSLPEEDEAACSEIEAECSVEFYFIHAQRILDSEPGTCLPRAPLSPLPHANFSFIAKNLRAMVFKRIGESMKLGKALLAK